MRITSFIAVVWPTHANVQSCGSGVEPNSWNTLVRPATISTSREMNDIAETMHFVFGIHVQAHCELCLCMESSLKAASFVVRQVNSTGSQQGSANDAVHRSLRNLAAPCITRVAATAKARVTVAAVASRHRGGGGRGRCGTLLGFCLPFCLIAGTARLNLHRAGRLFGTGFLCTAFLVLAPGWRSLCCLFELLQCSAG